MGQWIMLIMSNYVIIIRYVIGHWRPYNSVLELKYPSLTVAEVGDLLTCDPDL